MVTYLGRLQNSMFRLIRVSDSIKFVLAIRVYRCAKKEAERAMVRSVHFFLLFYRSGGVL